MMSNNYHYDIIIVGGGLGGAALGRSLANHGIRVLILEREIAFRDRVRGEYMHPWGVTEAKAVGLYDLLRQTCGYETRFRVNRIIGLPVAPPRDLVATSPHQVGSLHFYHPGMQELVLSAAMQAGANVQRGVPAIAVMPKPNLGVRIQSSEGERVYNARLVIGADGRTSACRKWGGFTVHHDPDRMIMAGVLLNNLKAPEDSVNVYVNPEHSQFAFTVPLGNGRFRCYAGFYQQPGRHRLSGSKAVAEFINESVAAGMPAEWFIGAQIAGPLASFDCADTWVPHPYQEGIALLGDAAACSDPSFGCGLSLVLRDVRVLSNLLLAETDWDAAAHSYADEHDHYFGSLHRLTGWMTKLFYEPGPLAAARRKRAFERITEDPKRVPDLAGLGPESPSDEAAYRNLFGEDRIDTS
jgi:2-polyprenyl-6-methoxyphenol hydroxylase-like FAD-dependent oxidoreductase